MDFSYKQIFAETNSILSMYLDVKIEIRSVDLDKCHLSRNLKVHGKRILPLFVIPKLNCLDLLCLKQYWLKDGGWQTKRLKE